MKNPSFWLILILICAFLVRFAGFWLVGCYIDEATLLYRAKQVLTGEEYFNPHFPQTMIAYGMFISYLQALFMKLVYTLGQFWPGWHSVDDAYSTLRLSTRFLSVLAGTGAVYLTYLLGKKLLNVKVGLLSALILAFSFNHVAVSKYSLVDIYISFFVSLSAYFAVLIFREQKNNLRNYLFSGLFATLAFSLKYNLPVFVPLILAHGLTTWQSLPKSKKSLLFFLLKWWRREIFISLFVAVGVFIMVNPYLAINPRDFLWQLRWILNAAWNFPYGGKDVDGIPNIIWYLHYMAKVGLTLPFFAFVFSGIIIAFFRYRTQALFLLSYPVVQLFLLELYTPRTDRYPVWWLPMLAIFGGLFLFTVFDFLIRLSPKTFPRRLGQKILLGVLIFLIAFPIVKVLAFHFALLFQQDTRQEARIFLIEKSRPVYFMVDLDGKFMGIEGLQVLNFHSLIFTALDLKSPSPYNVFRYPGEYVLVSSFNSDEYLYVFSHNPNTAIFNKNPGIKLNHYLGYLKEIRMFINFLEKVRFVKSYSHFWFGNNFYNAIRLPGGGTDIGITSNPEIKIYKIPDLTDQLPPLSVNYYPEPVRYEVFELLLPLVGARMEADPEANLKQAIFIEGSQKAILRTLRSPLPAGEYRVDISARVDPRRIIAGKVYGFATFGDKNIEENISYQEIKGKNLKNKTGYQTISLPFKLSDTSLTGIELAWGGIPLWVEKIEIRQTKR